MTVSFTQTYEWDSAHRVAILKNDGAIHGHRYQAKVSYVSNSLKALGRVTDRGKIHRIVSGWILLNLHNNVLVSNKDLDLIGFCCHQLATFGSKRPYLFSGVTSENLIGVDLCSKFDKLLSIFGVRVLSVDVSCLGGCSC